MALLSQRCPYCQTELGQSAARCSACGRFVPPLPQLRPTDTSQELRRTKPPPITMLQAKLRGTTPLSEQELAADEGPTEESLHGVQENEAGDAHDFANDGYTLVDPSPDLNQPLPPWKGPLPRQRTPPQAYTPVVTVREPTTIPPPTRISIETQTGTFRAPASIPPMPVTPGKAVFASVPYVVSVIIARWKRRQAIKVFHLAIKKQTGELDQILTVLGQTVQNLGIDNPVTHTDKEAILAAEDRSMQIQVEFAHLQDSRLAETERFAEQEKERNGKCAQVQATLEQAEAELSRLFAEQRGLRDKSKQIERQQKAYLKAAADRENDAAKQSLGEQRTHLRRSAEDHRKEAAQFEPEKQNVEARLTSLENPIAQHLARVEALKAELVSTRRSLSDLREGHRQKLTEFESEKQKKNRELEGTRAEISKRFGSLGTLVHLHRLHDPRLTSYYDEVDKLRTSIGNRNAEIERLQKEIENVDSAATTRGWAIMLGAVVAFLSLTAIILTFV